MSATVPELMFWLKAPTVHRPELPQSAPRKYPGHVCDRVPPRVYVLVAGDAFGKRNILNMLVSKLVCHELMGWLNVPPKLLTKLAGLVRRLPESLLRPPGALEHLHCDHARDQTTDQTRLPRVDVLKCGTELDTVPVHAGDNIRPPPADSLERRLMSK